MRTWRPLEKIVERIEAAEQLDGVAETVGGWARKLIPPGPVEDVLTGVPAGHPLHPAIVAVPIGAWVSVGLLDALGEDAAARRLTAFGCVTAVPAAAAGASDWVTTSGAERRVGLVHALVNDAALTAYGLSWFARRRGHRARGIALSALGAGLISAAGWLGGHLAYGRGVGVDTTAFQQFPQDWTDAGPESDIPAEGGLAQMEADGIPLLVTRRADAVIAMADRCTHRGGPLHEGAISGGCVTCPLHGSEFSLDDGTVRSGPATRPQPTFETRIHDGRLEVRRHDVAALRTNPVGR